MSKKATLAEKYDVAMHCSGLGDSLFSRGLWEEAKKPYETAINQICFSTDAELVDLLGILHSKVAAVNLRQNYFWKALQDSNEAIDSGCTRQGYLQQAESYSHLHCYERATIAYRKAADLENDSFRSERYRVSAEITKKRQEELIAAGPIQDFADTDLMLSKDTSSDELLSFDLQQPDNPNSEGLLIFCRQLFEQGILQLDSGDYPFATAKLTDAILGDSRSFHLPTSTNIQEFTSKITDHIRKQFLEFSIDVEILSVGDSLSIEIRQNYSTGSRARSGRFIQNLGIILSGAFVLAFMKEREGSYGEAILRYRYILETYNQWVVTTPEEIAGYSEQMNLPIAFTSEVKIRLLECMMKGHQMLFRNSEIIEGGAERELEPFGLGEIMRVWEDSVKLENRPESLSVEIELKSKNTARLFLSPCPGFVHRHLASLSENIIKNGVARYLDRTNLERAAVCDSLCSDFRFKYGDPSGMFPAFSSLHSSLFMGGLKVDGVLSIYSMLVSYSNSLNGRLSVLYGVPNRSSEIYLMTIQICDSLKGLLASKAVSLDTKLKPIPIIRRSDIPRKKTWKDMVDMKLVDALVGDYTVVYWID